MAAKRTATQSTDLINQAADFLRQSAKDRPAAELCDSLLRLGIAVEDAAPRARHDLFELGNTLGEVAGMIAADRVSGTPSLVSDLRRAARLFAEKKSAQWLKSVVHRVTSALQRQLRSAKPELGLADRRILVIDDDPTAQKAIGMALRQAGFVPVSALYGEAALRRLRVMRPALIVLDVEMPDVRGPQILRRIRADARLAAVPVIFVSAVKKLDVKLEALRSGADDYITKPFRPEELATRVAARLARGAVLQEIAIRDPLTGVATHRFFHEKLEEELARFARYKSPFTVACLDVDDLAAVNVNEGYDVGDRMLIRTAQILRAGMRTSDLIARLNGGEFGIIMPQTKIEGALIILDRLRERLALRGSSAERAVGISGGLAGCPETTVDRRALLAASREALEVAKRRGKGRLVRAGDLGERAASQTVVAAPMTDAVPDVLEGLSTQEVRSLRDVFVRDYSEHLRRLDGVGARAALRDRARAIGRIGHFLAGSGAIGGQPELSTLGDVLEASTDQLLAAGNPPPGTETILGEVVDALQRMGAGLRAGTYHPSEAVSLEQRLRITLGGARSTGAAATDAGFRADVLVVDDEKISQTAIGASLRRAGFQIREAYSGQEALDAVDMKTPDIIILDVQLPDMDGHEVLQRVRANSKLQLVPVVFVTAKKQLDDKLLALRTGADDYITKPFSPEELVARIGSRLERAKISKDLALRDGLTGLYNHRFFQERLEQELVRAARYLKPFCLALIDIDNFKTVNDRFGHQTGDTVLRALGASLVSQLRSTDIVARYGGEEFAVILPETGLVAAVESLERVRKTVSDELRVKTTSGGPLQVTFSGGVAEATTETKEAIFERVDSALYTSKHTGKNRVTVAEAAAKL